MMRRRAFLAMLGVTLGPRIAHAQRPARVPHLGVLLLSDPGSDPNMRAARDRLRELGYAEGQNLTVEYRYAEGQAHRLRELAADLVRARPDVIFTLGGDVAPFAKAATSTIPIVMAVSGDPVRAGLVASLNAPGGNVTGVTLLTSELAAKRLQFLKDVAPRLSRVAVIWSPDHADDEFARTQEAAQTLRIDVLSLEVRERPELDAALQRAVTAGVDGLMAVPSRMTIRNRDAIVEFAARHRLPLAGGWGLWAESGALLSYGPDVNDMVRRAAGYLDQILKGAKPGALPIQQPTRFELVINTKVASALGLTPSPAVLLQADGVIQ